MKYHFTNDKRRGSRTVKVCLIRQQEEGRERK